MSETLNYEQLKNLGVGGRYDQSVLNDLFEILIASGLSKESQRAVYEALKEGKGNKIFTEIQKHFNKDTKLRVIEIQRYFREKAFKVDGKNEENIEKQKTDIEKIINKKIGLLEEKSGTEQYLDKLRGRMSGCMKNPNILEPLIWQYEFMGRLPYHNIDHIVLVLVMSQFLAISSNTEFTDGEMDLLAESIVLHDIANYFDRASHEDIASSLIDSQTDYSNSDEVRKLLISATKMDFGIMKQVVPEVKGDIDGISKEKIKEMIEIMCDSDLINSGLSYEDSCELSDAIHQELHPDQKENEAKRREFFVITAMLCDPNHPFLSKSAQKFFGAQKTANFHEFCADFDFKEAAFKQETLGQVKKELGF